MYLFHDVDVERILPQTKHSFFGFFTGGETFWDIFGDKPDGFGSTSSILSDFGGSGFSIFGSGFGDSGFFGSASGSGAGTGSFFGSGFSDSGGFGFSDSGGFGFSDSGFAVLQISHFELDAFWTKVHAGQDLKTQNLREFL